MERWTRNEQLVCAGIWWAELETQEGYEFLQDYDFSEVTQVIEGWLEKYPYGHNFQKYIRNCFEEFRTETEHENIIEEIVAGNKSWFMLCLDNYATGKVLIQCTSLPDCVKEQLNYIHQFGLGASDMDYGFGNVYKDGELVYEIAYNGRIKDKAINDENIFLNVETGKYYKLDDQLNEIEVNIPLDDRIDSASEYSNKKTTILVATNIEWDTDGDKEVLKELPTEIEIPDWIDEDDYDEIENYLSDVTGYCHFGFSLEEVTKGKEKNDDFFCRWKNESR